MSSVVPCPDDQVLTQLLLGNLQGPQRDSWIAHLKQCAGCAARLQTIHRQDTFMEALRANETIPEGQEQEAAARLLAKLQGIPSVPLALPIDSATKTDNLVPMAALLPEPEESQFLLPAQGPDELGRLGHYRVLKVLGSGGMGKVYEAEDMLLSRKVALKVMKTTIAENEVARQRFIQEAKAAARIEHDNIVPIFQIGEDRGIPFLAMPLLSGRSLDDLLRKVTKLKVMQIINLGLQIAEGLKAAHERGLIHRDIKPANIWIEPIKGGRIKILDFGLARSTASVTHLTQSGIILGTPAYMAPEQAQSHPVDHRCDLFSLGCVLYHMCTGKRPFVGENTMRILLAVAKADPTRPDKLNPDIPPVLSDLVMKLLEKDPNNRVGSAADVIQILTNLQKELSAPAETPSLSQKVEQDVPVLPSADCVPATDVHKLRPGSRTPVLLAVLGVAALLLVCVGGGTLFFFGSTIMRLVAGRDEPVAENKGDQPSDNKENTPAAMLDTPEARAVHQLKTADSAEERCQAAALLAPMGKQALSVVPEMKAALGQEKDAKVREAIVSALGKIAHDTRVLNKDPQLEQHLIAALKDEDPLVRRSAAHGLGALASGSEGTRQALDAALADPIPLVRREAASSLGEVAKRMREQNVVLVPSLRKALGDTDSVVKQKAANAFLYIGDREKVRELMKDFYSLCRDPDVEVSRAALKVLGYVLDERDKDAIPILQDLLKQPNLENRRQAALVLASIPNADAKNTLPFLLEAINNGDLETRRQAVLAIYNIGPAAVSAVPELTRLLEHDPDKEIRRHAAVALGGVGKAAESAAPALVRKIQDPTETRDIRLACAVTLKHIGAVAAVNLLIPDLLKVLADPQQDAFVRERVIWVLRAQSLKLRTVKGTEDVFVKVLGEAPKAENRMLRYGCAYMLGMIWQKQAPDAALDVLTEFLHDTSTRLVDRPAVSHGKITMPGKGDGRVMVVDALKLIGPARYAARPAIMSQLRKIAADEQGYEPLRKKAADLLRIAKGKG